MTLTGVKNDHKKKYSKEFKLDAISLVLEQDYSQTEAAQNLAINATMLRRWTKEYHNEEEQAFRGNGKLTEEQQEIRRLRKENWHLKMEKEILKNRLPGNRVPMERNRLPLYSSDARTLAARFLEG